VYWVLKKEEVTKDNKGKIISFTRWEEGHLREVKVSNYLYNR